MIGTVHFLNDSSLSDEVSWMGYLSRLGPHSILSVSKKHFIKIFFEAEPSEFLKQIVMKCFLGIAIIADSKRQQHHIMFPFIKS